METPTNGGCMEMEMAIYEWIELAQAYTIFTLWLDHVCISSLPTIKCGNCKGLH